MIYFLLPAYNENDNLSEIFKSIKSNFDPGTFKIILVNDGSTDGTGQTAANSGLPVTVISHAKNKGLGAALQTGFSHAFEVLKENDILVALDADNTHPIEITKSMVEKINGNNADIVIASRYCGGGEEKGLKYYRKIYSLFAGLMFTFFFKYKGLRDYTCGYRAYKGEFLMKLRQKFGAGLITETGFPAGTEILLRSLGLKPVIMEVPLILRYDLKKGKSKMKVFRTILAYLRLVYRIKKR